MHFHHVAKVKGLISIKTENLTEKHSWILKDLKGSSLSVVRKFSLPCGVLTSFIIPYIIHYINYPSYSICYCSGLTGSRKKYFQRNTFYQFLKIKLIKFYLQGQSNTTDSADIWSLKVHCSLSRGEVCQPVQTVWGICLASLKSLIS